MSIELLRLVLAGLPPTANQMYRTGRNGQRYKRVEVEEWQESVAEQMREAWNNPLAFMGEVKVRIEFRVNGKRRWDIDNRLKALLDCLEKGGVIKDDAQIAGIEARRIIGEETETVIEVSEYPYMSEKSA